jgi:hypothetical protein
MRIRTRNQWCEYSGRHIFTHALWDNIVSGATVAERDLRTRCGMLMQADDQQSDRGSRDEFTHKLWDDIANGRSMVNTMQRGIHARAAV